MLAGADISQEECCIRNPASGIRYHALVVPRLAAVTLSALELFQKCADCGIPVIVNDLSPAVTVLGTDSPEAGSNAVIRLLSSENVTNARSGEYALKSLQYILPPNIELIGDEGQVVALSKRDPDSGKISYIAVNTSNVSRKVALVLDYPDRSAQSRLRQSPAWMQKVEYGWSSQQPCFQRTGFPFRLKSRRLAHIFSDFNERETRH